MILGTLVQGLPGNTLVDKLISHTYGLSYYNSRITTLGGYKFYANTALTTINCPNVSNIGYGCFTGCTNLKSVSLPQTQVINGAAFYDCTQLKTSDIPWLQLSNIANTGAFRGCTGLTSTIECPMCQSIGEQNFYGCNKVDTFSFMAATTIGSNACRDCTSLTTVYIPNAWTINTYAFHNCQYLTSLTLPHYSAMQSMICEQCYRLNTVTLNWSSATQISNRAFSKCYNLLSLYLLGPTVLPLQNVNAFTSTPISNYTTSTGGVQGSIFVPESLYSSYIAATNWSTYAARFVSMTSQEILSITGSWTQTLSATFSAPTSSPIYVTDNLKSYISNVVATHYDGTTATLTDDDYSVSGTRGQGGRVMAICGDGGRTTKPMVMAVEYELPVGYTRVGYIEAPASGAYINTEIIPLYEDNLIATHQPQYTYNGNGEYIIYAGNTGLTRIANQWCIYFGSTTQKAYTYYQIYGSSGGTLTTQNNVFQDYPYAVTHANTGSVTFTKSTDMPTVPYYIFARNNNGTAEFRGYKLRIWYVEITGRMKLIPCIRNSDNTVGMYDLMGNICSLTNTPFFINAGAGSFTYGYNP